MRRSRMIGHPYQSTARMGVDFNKAALIYVRLPWT
jgi:hypothetical protein